MRNQRTMPFMPDSSNRTESPATLSMRQLGLAIEVSHDENPSVDGPLIPCRQDSTGHSWEVRRIGHCSPVGGDRLPV
jgi:hypothetical protein